MNVFKIIKNSSQENQKGLAILIDPDNLPEKNDFDVMLDQINRNGVDYIFVGGSLTVKNNFEDTIKYIQARTTLPVILFPGSIDQITPHADAILFLSLISGRNPELLIGNHVITAPKIRSMQLEAISTGYLLVSCGKLTTANYISNTFPIPYNKPEIAMATAIAGEMLGMQCIYMDGGSGSEFTISEEMIKMVKQNTSIPLIIGGGIRDGKQAEKVWNAGADIIVIGTAFENNPMMLEEISVFKNKSTVQN